MSYFTYGEKRLIRKFGGWYEKINDREVIVYFPSPYQKDQFNKALTEYHQAQKQADEDEIKYIRE